MEHKSSQEDYEHNDGLGDLLKEREKLEFSWAKTSVVIGVLLSVIVLSGVFIIKFGKDIVNQNTIESRISVEEESSTNNDYALKTTQQPKKIQPKKVSENTTRKKPVQTKKFTSIKQKDLKKKKSITTKPSSKEYYKVITGTFKNKKYAENLIGKLKKSGFDSFYRTKVSSTGDRLYRVQAGSFFKKTDAEKFSQKLTSKKFQSYIIKE